jgi:hypothetical protein
MSAGLDALKHVLELIAENPFINGFTGLESNPDANNETAKALPNATFQGQLDPDPDHHFPAVHQQLFFGAIHRHSPGHAALMHDRIAADHAPCQEGETL